MPVKKRDADLNIFPTVLEHEHTHITLGDIHGNALKLIYTLIEEGVLKLDKDQYKQLCDIYKMPVDELTKEQIETFESIIAKTEVKEQRAITLIGDELADRGNNDYFTLLVLKKLRETNVDMDIMISNHSMEFIKDYERPFFTGNYNLGKGQGASLANMSTLIKKGLVQEDNVRSMVDSCYKPIVKAIGYTISAEGRVTLFSHAPIGLETVEALANKFNVPYKDATPKEFFSTIDAINESVRTKFTNKELIAILGQEGHSSSQLPIPTSKPLMRLVWNRAVGDELKIETSSGIKVKFVHGHIGDGEILKNGKESLRDSHENLDTSFAKARELFKTGPNSLHPKVNIVHLTRQSSNFTQKQLTDEKLKELGPLALFESNLQKIGEKSRKLKAQGYEKASQEAINLFNSLTDRRNDFITKKSISPEKFIEACNELIDDAQKGELKNHRGFFGKIWHGILTALNTVGLASTEPTDSMKKMVEMKKSLNNFKEHIPAESEEEVRPGF